MLQGGVNFFGCSKYPAVTCKMWDTQGTQSNTIYIFFKIKISIYIVQVSYMFQPLWLAHDKGDMYTVVFGAEIHKVFL
jgi:hypothetical protein